MAVEVEGKERRRGRCWRKGKKKRGQRVERDRKEKGKGVRERREGGSLGERGLAPWETLAN